MNKIYRVVWNSTLMQWVVTSELGRGKIKRATNKALAGLAILLAPMAQASECNTSTLTCDLDRHWSSSANNYKAGAVDINDGQTYRINGPETYDYAEGSYKVYNSINDLIAAGYIDAEPLPPEDKQVNLGSKSQNITITDPITNASTVVSVYSSDAMSELESGYSRGGYGVAKSGPVDVYYQTRFVTVTDGTADIYADGLEIAGGHRDTQLIYADSTVSGQAATAIWNSQNTVYFGTERDYSTAPTDTATARVSTYKGDFSAFDGTTTSVNSLSDLQSYNNWLISKIQSGELDIASYDAELQKAYTTVSTNYTFNMLPPDPDPILTQPAGASALLMANGDQAKVILSETGSITGDIRGPGVGSTDATVFRLTNGGTGINDGVIETTYYTATVLSGSSFFNNGKITTGTQDNGVPGLGVYVANAGSRFINTNELNISPSFWSDSQRSSGMAKGITVSDYASATNEGTINIGITEGDKGRALVGGAYGVVVGENGIFTNSGEMYIGRSPGGDDVYAAPKSAAIVVDAGNAGTVNNEGSITLGTMTDGAVGIRVQSEGTHDVTNSGTIRILSNGNDGEFVAKQNIGIFADNGAKGIKNTGLIDIQGTNSIGIKTLSGGQVSSSGDINITGGADPATGLRNYGAWAEGAGSQIDISGTVNLKGDGAIGVHARDQGTINLSGNAAVTFADGESQIGYYVYGTGSKIVNTSTGAQEVTTKKSTLMRLDGGAAFMGSALATSTMTASGESSTVIVATGAGTTVDSGGMTVNVSGKNATGFVIEGGAEGTIDAATTINLTGEGAIAAIADGQGHDLTGAARTMTDAEKQATILSAGAHLHSALNGVTGYIARNLASLTNSGDIYFYGQRTTGIKVEEGASGHNSGHITLNGAGSTGLVATASTADTQLTSTGNITLNGDWDGADESTRSVGVKASGDKVNVTIGDGVNAATINLHGAGTVGVYATAGSQVTLKDKVNVTFDSNKSDQVGFWVDGEGSTISTQASSSPTLVHGDGATLFNVTNGAAMSGDLNLNLSGKANSSKVTAGIRVNGEGSTATLGSSSHLTIGTNATGVIAEDGGQAVIAAGAAFTLSGDNAMVGHAIGEESRVENRATVTSLAGSTGSTAFKAQDGGTITNQGNINLSAGSGHTAIDIDNGHVVNTGNIIANGTAIHIKGSESTISNSGTIEAVDGVAAIHVDAGAGLNLSAASTTGKIVARGTADGILLDTGALSLNVADTFIDLSDASSTGIGIHNVAGIEGITLDNTRIDVGGNGIGIKTGATLAKNNSGTINVNNGTGILVQNENGSAAATSLDISDSAALTINVTGSGTGIKATLDSNDRTLKSNANVNINSATGGPAIDVSGAKTVNNAGKLISQSTVAGGSVMDVHEAATISNSGTIQAASADLTAIAMSNSGDKTFTNSGNIVGKMDFASGDNTINLNAGTVDGDILASGGANHLTATGGSVHTGNVVLAGDKNNTVTVTDAATLGDLTMGDGDNSLTAIAGAVLGASTLGAGDNTIVLTNATTGTVTAGDGNNSLTAGGATTSGAMTFGNGDNQLALSDTATVNGAITTGTGKNSLTLSDSAHIDSFSGAAGGEHHVTVKGNATFDTLDAGTGGNADSLTFDNADYTLAASADVQHFDMLNLRNGASFTTNQQIQMGDGATTSGRIDIDENSALNLTATGSYTLNHALSGDGLIDVQSGTDFNFGSSAGSQFAGTVQMNSETFSLSGLNTAALTNATLKVMADNVTTVGSGVQTIGGLGFDGGTVDFDVSIPNAATAGSRIAANTLDASGTGNVMINSDGFDNATPPVVDESKSLLDQQNETLVQLVSANSVTGEGGNLKLVDENGNVLSNSTAIDVLQNGVHAADGWYDYRLTTKDDDGTANGLYVGYGLTRLDLLTHGNDKLVINTAGSQEKTFSAQITGSGDLGVRAGDGADALTLSNLENSYTGETDLQSGTLILGTDNALGQTASLNMAAGTTVDMNGKTQTVGALAGGIASTLMFNGGDLTLKNGGSSSGALTGSGSLTVAGGTLNVNNANADLSVTTTVKAGAEAILSDVLALGTGSVVADGDVTLNNADGTFANALSGSGTLNSQNGSDVRLGGDNTAFSGVMTIDDDASLTVSEAKHVGATSEIQNANRFIVDNAAAMTLDTVVSSVGDLIKRSVGTLTLAVDNLFSGELRVEEGVVAISQDANLGDGSQSNRTVLDGGDLQITADITTARNVTLNQSGSVIVDDGVTATMNGWDALGNATSAFTKEGAGTLIWTGDNSANRADVNIANGVLQIADLTNLASSTGTVNLSAPGTLSIYKTVADDLDFTRTLAGSGTLQVDLGDSDSAFTFNASAAGGDFSGTVAMNNGRFVLDEAADATMAGATLALNGGDGKLGHMKLEGEHAMGGLTFNGGQLEVDYSSSTHRPTGHLTVDTLDATGGGTLAVNTPDSLPNPLPDPGASLFDQDDGVYDQIVAAQTVNGAGSQLALTQADGAPLGEDTVVGLEQNGVVAGNAHYNYFGAVTDDGLYLGYGLTQLDAFADQSIVLSNAGAVDNKLGAKLTGDGGFTFNAADTIYIGNAASDYRGASDVNSGKVVLITDNGFGQTSALNMQSGTQVDLNGNAQTVGELNTADGSVLDINGGELTVTNGGLAAGIVTGAGHLTLAGGTLNVTQNNSGYTGTTRIDEGATATLSKPQGLGKGAISLDGTLNLDTARGTLFNALSGNGDVTLTHNADIYLGGNNQHFSGQFDITSGSTLTATAASHLGDATVSNSGTLALDTDSRWTLSNTVEGSGTLIKRGTGTVLLDADNVQAGLTSIENGALQLGETAATTANLRSDVTIGEYGVLGGYGTVTGNVTNAGNLVMGDALTGSGHGTFTIDGDYIGNDGTVIFNTDLEGDNASTDRLNITGDSTGTSKVTVVSARGEGAQTVDGIKLIDVQGQSTGTFTLNGRAVAGAYEYFLYQGGVSTPDDGDWYLRSTLEDNGGDDNNGGGNGGGDDNGGGSDTPTLRPEAGGYVANMAAANQLFRLRLEDREGRAENSSLWLRQTGSRLKHRDGSGQLHTATNSYVIQGGGELFSLDTADNGRAGFGVMAGYGNAQSKTYSRRTGYKSDSSVDGYTVGVYGTWYQNAATLDGAYVDSWAQYSWLDASVSGDGLSGESYNMDGFSASLEAGYRLPLYESDYGRVYLTPQGQVSWSGITADTVRESNGTKVTSSGENNVQTRLGVKISRDSVSSLDKGKGKLFTVYAETNWLYNSEQPGATMDGKTVSQAGSRNVAELKVGAEGKLNKHLNVWTNVAQQVGDKGYNDTAVMLGLKYKF
ncbi:autotransporter outer membrane beta-barrel domain-containing protein [Phytobacter massiliensis]|uniref:autotransporter outer membrane beta-barrel domain-containing protein n=1 Tax=Phytobacter massiliensis TaxID=1485952 RepID=UPI000309FBF9|nr:autotransporter outer membrane beta-barrel domain-containing protein [Phytobacter massiliensis]